MGQKIALFRASGPFSAWPESPPQSQWSNAGACPGRHPQGQSIRHALARKYLWAKGGRLACPGTTEKTCCNVLNVGAPDPLAFDFWQNQTLGLKIELCTTLDLFFFVSRFCMVLEIENVPFQVQKSWKKWEFDALDAARSRRHLHRGVVYILVRKSKPPKGFHNWKGYLGSWVYCSQRKQSQEVKIKVKTITRKKNWENFDDPQFFLAALSYCPASK